MTRSLSYAIVGILLLSGLAYGESNVGGAWLEIGPGGRAAGLAEAVTASVEGPTATYWNPAAVGVYRSGVEIMHAEWIQGSVSQYVSGSFQVGKWGLGGSVLHVGTGDMQLRDAPSASPIGTFESRSYAIGASVSRELPLAGIRLGAGVKYMQDAIYIYDAEGWAADVGLLKTGLFDQRLDLALTARHLGAMEALLSEAYDLPATYSAGAAWHIGRFGLAEPTVMVDAVQVADKDLSVRGALEVEVSDLVALRGGYATGYEARGMSFGLGIHWKGWRFDYGYSPFDYNLGNAQRISLGHTW